MALFHVASMLINLQLASKLETSCTVWLCLSFTVNAFHSPIPFLLNVTSISGYLADNLAHGQSMHILTIFRYYFTIEACFHVLLYNRNIFLWIILQLKIQFYVLLSSLYQVGQNQSEMNAYQQNYWRWLSSSVEVHADKFKQSELDSRLL